MKEMVNSSSQTVRTCDVFISYRRDGGDMTAMYFYQALKERGYKVFYDLEVLRAGKFNEALLSSIQSCKDFLLILSPHALDRCNDDNDWVRQEIAEALRTKKNIIPVMLKGFAFPETLPDDIDDIRYQNGLTCTTEYFEESINRLCERYLKSLPEKSGKQRNPLIAALAVIAVLALAVGGFMAMRSRNTPLPEPTSTAAVELTPTPEPTSAPTDTPEPTPTEAPTAAPTPEPVRDTDFPLLIRGMEIMPGVTNQDDEDYPNQLAGGPVFNIPLPVTRGDIVSVTFLPSLEGAPQDAVDASEATDRRVLAWITEAGDGLYDLFIAGDGGVKVPERSEDANAAMFAGYTNLERVNFNGCVDFSARTNFERLFWCCYKLKSVDFTGVYTGNGNNFSGTFGFCQSLEALDLSAFDTAQADTFSGMFLACERLKALDLRGFDGAMLQNMEGMFAGCTALESVNLSGLDTGRVTDMSNLFSNCEALETVDVSRFSTARVTNMAQMFENCRSLKALDVSGFDTSRAADMTRMFAECQSLEALDVSGFDTARVTGMRDMFVNCKSLKALDVSGFNTARVTDMSGMFCDCHALETLDLTGWDTANAEDMRGMFWSCQSMDNIDLSGWDTGKVTDMENMFNDCQQLYRLDLSSWNTSRVTVMTHMFANCPYAVELLVTNWDISSVERMEGMFQGCSSLESIGCDPTAFGQGDTLDMYDGCDKLTDVNP